MTPRTRLAVLVGIIVVAVVGAVSYVVASRRAQQDAISNAPPVASRDDLDAVLGTPHLVFRSTALGSNYGFVAAVPIDDAGGPRAITPAQCERVYTRAQLLDHVWGGNVYVEERTVDVHIRRLRKTLEPARLDGMVQTVRGSGYRFSASL